MKSIEIEVGPYDTLPQTKNLIVERIYIPKPTPYSQQIIYGRALQAGMGPYDFPPEENDTNL